MANTYWLVNLSSENYKILKKRSFDILGFSKKDNKLTNKIDINDNVIFYVSDFRSFVGQARVNSKKFHETKQIWDKNSDENLPYRFKLNNPKILDENNFVSAYHVAPSLNYIKKWAPENWYLALLSPVHVISQNDYSIISSNLDSVNQKTKIIRKNKSRRNKKKKKV